MRGNYYHPFSLRISEEMHYKLRIIADSHKRWENKEIEFVLKKYIKGYEAEHGTIPENPLTGNLT